MSKKNKTVQTFIDEPQVDEQPSDEAPVSIPSDEGDGLNEGSSDSKGEPAKAIEYIVNPDRPKFSICGTRKGVVGQGEKVAPEMFRGGEEVFNSLLKSGAIVEKKD